MSQSQIDKLKQFLVSEGYVQDENFSLSGDGGNSLVFSVTIELDELELPEDLQPFAWSPDQVERAMWKGNAEKQTWNGANFELALRDYAGDLMANDPETLTLEATLETVDTMPKLEEYQAARQVIWERICSDPKIVAWEHFLDNELV